MWAGCGGSPVGTKLLLDMRHIACIELQIISLFAPEFYEGHVRTECHEREFERLGRLVLASIELDLLIKAHCPS